MPDRVVGLDLGSHAVRAADVVLGDVPELRAFGQVGLPTGAMEHGEVVDPGAVAAALRRLWREARIRGRRVRVGFANPRTIVRQVEMPALPEADLRAALEFQAGDFIPMPPDEIHLDFRVLETFEADGEAMVRVLIAAAHQDTVDAALTAVREAGLQAVALDLVPFALVRSLGTLRAPDDTAPVDLGVAPTARAIVSVGSGVTVVVVHEDGVPRFVRIVPTGGDRFTEAVAAALDLAPDEAEAIKRQAGADAGRGEPTGDDVAASVAAAIEGPVGDLVNDVRGSVDFYASQGEALPVSEVVVTGGGALAHGFVDRLGDALGLPVRIGDVTPALRIGDIGFAAEEIPALRPYLPVPIGLALGGARDARSTVNLLPGRERRVLVVGRVTAAGGAALVALVVVLGALWLGRAGQVSDAEDDLDAQQAGNRALQARIAQLEDARTLQTRTDDARRLAAGALANDVSWSRMLQEIARVIPGDVWLGAFSGNADAARAVATGEIGGAATFTAVGADFPSAAAWLQRLAGVPSFTGPWVTQAARGDVTELGATVEVVNFSGTASITDVARSERSREARARAGTTGTAPGTTTTSTTTPGAGA
jgi:type IV pilus assembly protein PilM